MNPINPETAGCYPTACKQSRLNLMHTDKQEIEICENTEEIENEYIRDAYMTCSQFYEKQGVIINPELLNKHSENKRKTHLRILEQCEISFFGPSDSPDICKVLSDAHDYELYEIDVSYVDTYERIVSEVEVDTWEKMAIDIIGSLGFFLGFSVITFAEFFMFFSDVIGTYVRGGKNKVESQS